MRSRRAIALGLLSTTVWLLISQPINAQDPVRLAPKNIKVLLENNRVRVYEVRIKPGEKIPMHSHPPHLTYSLGTAKGKYSLPNGEASIGEAKPGAVFWSEAITHASENVGTTEIHALVVELKESPKKKSK